MRDRLLRFATAAGASATAMPPKEGWACLKAWREVYCAPVYQATGKWMHGGFAWSTFDAGFFPCLKRHRAIEAYNKENASDLLVLPEEDPAWAIRTASKTPLDFSGLVIDLYIAPPSYAWTMVFTHEHPGIGPFYSRAEWLSGMT